MLLFVFVYLTTLFLAPQLWVEPFVDMRVDFFVYPLWLLAVFFAGRLPLLLTLSAQDRFFLLMLLWIAITTVVNGTNAYSSDIMINYVKWFVLYKLVSVSLPEMPQVRRTALLLVFFGLVLAIEGIQHKHDPMGLGWANQPLGWVDPSVVEAGGTGRTQWINIFDGPGVFCVAYTVGLPFLLQYVGQPFRKRAALVALAVLAPVLLAIYYTGSRGGLLTTLAIAGLYIALRSGIRPSRIALFGGFVAVLVMLAPTHLVTLDDQSKSGKHRVEMWIEGVEMVQQNPVFGIGKGNFLGYTGKLLAHNSAIEIMGEIGLIGLFLWFGLIYLSLKTLYLYYKEAQDAVDRSYVMALGISVLGYIVSAMFVTLEYETFYFLLGMCAAVGNNMKAPAVFQKRDFRYLVALTLGWFVGIKLFLMAYY